MKKIYWVLYLFVIGFSCFLFADTNDISRENIIIEGLSKKQLKDRIKYLEMAKYSDSAAVFEKLTQMYKVNNAIKDDVFTAMEWQNNNNKGIFSERFAEVMLDEYNRLKKESLDGKVSDCPHIDYLDLCIATCQEKHFPGFDKFMTYIMQNIDEVLEESWDYHYDPVRLKNTLIANCIFYFALRDKPGYMEKLAEVTKRGDIWEIGLVIDLFKEKKNDGIFDYLTKKLENDYKENSINPYLLDYYYEYANILNKKIPVILKEAKRKIDEHYSKQADELLKNSNRFDEKFFGGNDN